MSDAASNLTNPTTLPHGCWPSPIDTDVLTAGSVGLSSPLVDAAGEDGDGTVYWLESRPSEQGRTVLVRTRNAGTVEDVVPAPFNIRSGVHEYGGGAVAVTDGLVAFSDVVDGRVHVLRAGSGEPPRAITPDLPGRLLRFADLRLDLPRRRLLAVREDHRGIGEPGGPAECVNTVVALDLDVEPGHESAGEVLVDGHDFVSSPRLSPDGRRLAWLTWEHPNMPWDSTTMWIGDTDGGDASAVDGGPGVSITDIGWTAASEPVWFSDRSGFWNLVVDGQVRYSVEADCADAAWVLGGQGWAENENGDLLVRRHDRGATTLVRVTGAGATDVLTVAGLSDLAADGDDVVTVAAFPDRPAAVVRIAPDGTITTLRRSVSADLDPAFFSVAEPLTWDTPDGAESHGYLYRPRNPTVNAPEGELPPLVVLSHGGPTAAASPGLSLAVQFWTTRGIAVLDVDYGGSAGYGRAYRDRLQGKWGIVDVDDCCSGAVHLVDRGLVDPERMAIRGGSAGGYTTLAALTFRDTFRAGVSKYGIGDLEALATDTHKFESRYLDGLVGPYPADRQTYLDRSPIHHVEQLDCALLLLQGEDDKVVPPNQARTMADAVRAKGRPVALKLYPGEGHGFRGGDTVRDATLSELAFYGRIFGFTPAGEVPALQIDNLPA